MNLTLTKAGLNQRIIFELWTYNATLNQNQYDQRWGRIWLNVTTPVTEQKVLRHKNAGFSIQGFISKKRNRVSNPRHRTSHALITSINCLVNSINSQTAVLGKLTVGQTYLVTSKNSTALSDSQITPEIMAQIKTNPDINYVATQQIIQADLTTNEGNYSVTVRGVDDLRAYFRNRQSKHKRDLQQNNSQANLGTIHPNQPPQTKTTS